MEPCNAVGIKKPPKMWAAMKKEPNAALKLLAMRM